MILPPIFFRESPSRILRLLDLTLVVIVIGSSTFIAYRLIDRYQNLSNLYQRAIENKKLIDRQLDLSHKQNASISAELRNLKNSDPQKTAQALKDQAAAAAEAYQQTATLFELQADLRSQKIDTSSLDKDIVKILNLLSQYQYAPAQDLIATTKQKMDNLVALARLPVAVPAVESNSLPAAGFARQLVKTDEGDFAVALFVVDASSVRVVVDTAADSDCSDNCPVLPLANFISRNQGLSGINGGYFCPPDYARCLGKVNTFDTLVMNSRSKTIFNRAQNEKTSPVPLLIINGGNLTFYDQTAQWNIDQSQGGAIANHPLLLRGGRSVVAEESLEDKLKQKGTKGFIGKKGGQIIIGHIFAASVGQEAKVLITLGLEEALNLDGGGSSALWADGGYKVGPGRLLPVAVVLVRK